MDIMELDEAQGLTAEMVRGWLLGSGWEVREVGNGYTDAKKRFGESKRAISCIWETSMPWLLTTLASAEALSPQSLLREINPRMRPWPSVEAVEAHEKNGGRWLSKAPGDELIRCMTLSADRNEEDPVMATDDHGNDWWACDCEGWTFWPIDKHGNKIRYPERDGVPL